MRSEIDRRGIRKLIYEPALGDALLHHAEEAVRIIEMDPATPYKTGAYKESIYAERGRFKYVLAYIASSDRKALFIERGSHDRHGGWRPRHTLQSAARKAGMRVVQVESRGISAV